MSALTDKPIKSIHETKFKHAGATFVVKDTVHNRNGYWTLRVVRRGHKQNLWIDVLVDEKGTIIYVDTF